MIQKKIIILFIYGLLSFISIKPQTIYAHAGAGPPFLRVNGKYAQTNPYYQGESYINIPQDNGPENYEPNKPITFAVDTSQLLVPRDIADQSTFRWSFAKGRNFEQVDSNHAEAKSITHSYDQPGSYLVSLEVKAPGENDYQLIDTIQVNVLPRPDYKLPKVSVVIGSDSWQTNSSITFLSKSTFDHETKKVIYLWDFANQNLENGVQVDHTYTTPNLLSYVYHRVVDDHGMIADVGFNIRIMDNKIEFPPFGNMSSVPVVTEGFSNIASSSHNTNNQSGNNFLLLGVGVLFIIGLITTGIVLTKKSS